jgi:NADH-quinone oxidoreductase subunit C
VTSSPSETETSPLQEFADRVAETIGSVAEISFDTVKVRIAPEDWVGAHVKARDELDLVFFSWLSAIDEEVEERIELMSALSDVTDGNLVILSTDLDADDPAIPTLIEVFVGANWHEREAYEMFGIRFEGHPNLIHLYLPDAFIGHPLRKSYPLLSREVKPWPGKVDVEAMPEKSEEPSTENPEA